MSKRHQASRRRSYGRRQHEVHQREVRRVDPATDLQLDPWAQPDEQLGRVELELGRRFRFAVLD